MRQRLWSLKLVILQFLIQQPDFEFLVFQSIRGDVVQVFLPFARWAFVGADGLQLDA